MKAGALLVSLALSASASARASRDASEPPAPSGGRAEDPYEEAPLPPDASEPPPDARELSATSDEKPAITGRTALDTVLPSGLRIVVARDGTLPVAAVVLAIETGTEDDPSDRPGLVHALAYHLLQGNRELPPGGVARIAHDGGGLTSLAVGPTQVRFESLVPMSLLDDMLWAESQRLRSPTVDEPLWNDTLGWARRDARRDWALPLEALAAVHGAEGLGHPGRKASPALRAMTPRAVAQELAQRMSYARATLVVVSPLEPAAVLARARPLFADLPESSRHVHDRFSPPLGTGGPRRIKVPEADGSILAWPVPPGSEQADWARVWCRVINRQRRGKEDPRRARLRCHLDEDPRRATLILRASGVEDPLELVRARIGRIAEGQDDRLVDRQQRIVAQQIDFALSTPLGLGRRLATLDPRASPSKTTTHELARLTGLHALQQSDAYREPLALYRLEAAIQLIAADDGDREQGGTP